MLTEKIDSCKIVSETFEQGGVSITQESAYIQTVCELYTLL